MASNPHNASGSPRVDLHPKDRHHGQKRTGVWLSLPERSRLDRLLRRRQQTFRDWVIEMLDWAERQSPADGERVRVDVPEAFARMAAQSCAARVDEWEQLAREAKAAGEPLDALQYRRASGPWQDAADFFAGIQREYQRRARRTTVPTAPLTGSSGASAAPRPSLGDVRGSRR